MRGLETVPETKREPGEEHELTAVRAFWDAVAEDWRIQVGSDGDVNRRLNSDPVLWTLLGDVDGKRVLDAGCGPGYLTRQLADRGALVTGVDLSAEMIRIAQAEHPNLDFRTESISDLHSVEEGVYDAVVANYVLMDTPDLDGAVRAFHRVLRPGGLAVLVFSHPCFPQGRRSRSTEEEEEERVTYTWSFPYFEARQCIDPPWKHFKRAFIWFHRPLSRYWRAFRDAGFAVEELEEPHIQPERYASADSEEALRKLKERPYSIAFKLRK